MTLKIPGFCDQQGQVYFINDIKSNGTEINNIAHEVQHAKDPVRYSKIRT